MSATDRLYPGAMPALGQDMTQEQIEACVVWFATLSLADLRQRQSIHSEQISMAYARKMEAAVTSENIRLDMITDAISRRTFGMPQRGQHSDIGRSTS